LLKPPLQKTSRGNQTKVDQRTNIERELFLISQTRSPLNPIAASTKNRLMFDRLNSGILFPSMKPTQVRIESPVDGPRVAQTACHLGQPFVEDPDRESVKG